ncbi:hypothetical protein B0J17DRAFT_742645 [Rhizoctonia solani]|nr:hypothetical protein B0J17DRAFT_742645 [Rhizoctonia solani]
MRDIEQAVVVALVMTLVLVLVGPELDRANQYAVGRLNTDMVTCISQDIVNLLHSIKYIPLTDPRLAENRRVRPDFDHLIAGDGPRYDHNFGATARRSGFKGRQVVITTKAAEPPPVILRSREHWVALNLSSLWATPTAPWAVRKAESSDGRTRSKNPRQEKKSKRIFVRDLKYHGLEGEGVMNQELMLKVTGINELIYHVRSSLEMGQPAVQVKVETWWKPEQGRGSRNPQNVSMSTSGE